MKRSTFHWSTSCIFFKNGDKKKQTQRCKYCHLYSKYSEVVDILILKLFCYSKLSIILENYLTNCKPSQPVQLSLEATHVIPTSFTKSMLINNLPLLLLMKHCLRGHLKALNARWRPNRYQTPARILRVQSLGLRSIECVTKP